MTSRYPSVPGVTFKAIDGFPRYCVGDDGSVWSRHSGAWKRLRPTPLEHGHLQVELTGDSRCVKARVHVLVLEAFVGPRPEGLWGLHRDGNPANNLPGNLYWGTPTENVADARRHGTLPQGSRVHLSKLDEGQVKEIQSLLADGTPRAEIARRFGVRPSTITFIAKGETWKHVAADRPAAPSAHRHGKLSEEDIATVLRLRDEGESQRSIARRFGVNQAAISRLLNGKSYTGGDRTAAVVRDAKAIERHVDKLVAEVLDNRPGLFDEG